MDLQEARLFLQNLESDEIIQNFIAQGKSRYILFNVEELQQNFPDYTSRLSERLNQIAFSYLTVGCYLAEGESILEAIGSLKKGAELLEFNHKPIENRELHSKYYILASSIAFYSAYEYSRAFVILKEVEIETPARKTVCLLLRKDFDSLSKHIVSILIDSNYIPQRINITDTEESDINTKVWTFLCAKSIAYILDYFFTGNEDSLNMSKEILSDLLDLLQVEKEPSLWWCIRLFKIITGGLNRSSLWMILPPFFPSRQNLQVGAFIKSLAFRKPIPVVELFISQRNAAKKSTELSSLVVVCLPTSSGKTRLKLQYLMHLLKTRKALFYISLLLSH
ncbi:MAG: hypothetical protein IPN33_04475 [Saprospiraceae bacterium]|nr:hypothetical protein [Saprospiraceae bacterium]